MNITIIAVGKIKEKFMREGIKEYAKRLSRYCKLQIIEVGDERAPEGLSKNQIDSIKRIEGNKILSKISISSYVIALCIDGKSLSSEELSKKMDDLALEGISDITFVIGGSLGLSEEVLERSDYRLSFSRMTFPHQLMRVILLEQIYRSFKIIKGEPYHK